MANMDQPTSKELHEARRARRILYAATLIGIGLPFVLFFLLR
jgi:hypothetical protein